MARECARMCACVHITCTKVGLATGKLLIVRHTIHGLVCHSVWRYILAMTTGCRRTAAEVTDHRKLSPIGTTQHHFALSAEFASPRGRLDHVVVVSGEGSTYVFGANEDGDIIDFDPRAVVADVVDPASALLRLGYRVA